LGNQFLTKMKLI